MRRGVKNILALLDRADAADIGEGRVAYYRYNEVMRGISELYATPLDRVTACFAALSPNNDYVKNLRSAVTLIKGYREGASFESLPVSTYRHCAVRAWGYLDGVDFLGTVKGKKIRAFYQNILNPLDPYPVTIDGHAVNAWANERRNLKDVATARFDYEEVAGDFRTVARRLGLQAHQTQAIAWFAWKRINRILYQGQLELWGDASDLWKTLRSPEEIKPFTPGETVRESRERKRAESTANVLTPIAKLFS